MRTIKIWDLPTRVFHWALAASVILALLIVEDEGIAYAIHAVLGVSALMLVLFRLPWGFVGGQYARFGEFVCGWTATKAYTGQLLRLAPPRHLGHNPLGGWAVLILLLLTFLTALSGLLSGGLAGPSTAEAASDLHEFFGSLLQFMVIIHIAGVLIDWALTRDNLIAAMWHGRKTVDAASSATDARAGSGALAAIFAVLAVVLGGYLLSQIDLTGAPGDSRAESESLHETEND